LNVECMNGLGSHQLNEIIDYRLLNVKSLRHYGTCEICQINGHIVRVHMCKDSADVEGIYIDICNQCLSTISDPRYNNVDSI